MLKLKALLATAQARLAERALLVGGGYFAKTIANGGPVTHAALVSAGIAAAWVAAEYFTPINGILGYWKAAVKIDPALTRYSPPVAPKP